MSYGLKLYDTNGNVKLITPDDGSVIASGSLTMPTSLNGDNTYGEDISLGATYDEDEISVLVVPRRPVYSVNYNRFIDGSTLYYNTFYLNNGSTYYTRNTSTGIMTSFTAGNKTVDVKNTWNPVLSVFPIAFWDKMGATTFSNVRLFAATAYLFRDTNNDTNLSLAGTASGSGGTYGGGGDGGVDNVKDDNTSSWYGNGCLVGGGPGGSNSCAFTYTAQVDFTSATVTFIEILYRPVALIAGGTYANGQHSISLYYGSAWHEIFNNSWSHQYNPVPVGQHIIDSATGFWTGVTKIKVEAGGSAQSGIGVFDEALAEHVTYELRAWGPNSTNDSENSIVYSIGNAGITTVDYMICRKRVT